MPLGSSRGGGSGGGSSSGSTGTLQFNNGSGLFGGIAATSYDSGTGLLTWGSGQEVDQGNASTGVFVDLLLGSFASPTTLLNPPLKVNRYNNTTAADLLASGGGTGSGQLAAINGSAYGIASSENNTVGIYGGAISFSTAVAGDNDAVGIVGEGRIGVGGTGVATGGYFQGQCNSASGLISGIEVQARNYSGASYTYNASGFSGSQALWIVSNGTDATNGNNGAAAVITSSNGARFEVGIGFPAVNNSGVIGGVSASSFRDDARAARSIDIRGTHATAAIEIAASAGNVILNDNVLLGGTGVASVLHLRGTSGAGTAGTVSIQMEVGTNGGTIPLRIDNTGQFGIGTTPSTNRRLNLFSTYSTNTNASSIFSTISATHSSGTMSVYAGYSGSIDNNASGTGAITDMDGVRSAMTSAGARPVAFASSFHATTMTNAGGATLSEVAGLRLDPQTVGVVNWQIFSTGTAPSKLYGALVIGNAALATNATDGFLYIPTCAGTPTGVPTAFTGTVAMVFDTTNNKLYIYDGSWLGGTTPGAFV